MSQRTLIRNFIVKRINDKDKETLQDENIRFKSEINRQFDENKKLKLENRHLQKEIHMYECIIEERKQREKEKTKHRKQIDKIPDSEDQHTTGEQGLIIAQKKQLKESQKEIQDRDKIIEQFKKDVRITRLQEIQVELRFYQDECNRLRALLQSKFEQEALNKINKQEDLLETYKNDNITLSTLIKKLESDYNLLKQNHKEIQTELLKIKTKLNLSEKITFDKDKEILKLRQDISGRTIKDAKKEFKEILDQKKVEIDHLHSQNEALNQKNQLLEKKVKDLQIEFFTQQQNDGKEKLLLQKQVVDLRRQLEQTKILIQQNEDRHESMQSSPQHNRSPKRGTISIKKRVQKVNTYDVEILGIEVRIKMILANIRFQDMDDFFDKQNDISIKELIDIFKRKPFQMNNDNEAILLSRYLVEDNSEDWLIYDVEQTNNSSIVKSVFKNLIKFYDLFQEEEQAQISIEIAQQLSKFKIALVDAIKQIIISNKFKENICQYEDLLAALKFCDINLNQRQYEYLQIIVYKLNRNLDLLNYVDLLNYFDQLASKENEPLSVQQYFIEDFENPSPNSNQYQISFEQDNIVE